MQIHGDCSLEARRGGSGVAPTWREISLALFVGCLVGFEEELKHDCDSVRGEDQLTDPCVSPCTRVSF